jgi:hypothetical protein
MGKFTSLNGPFTGRIAAQQRCEPGMPVPRSRPDGACKPYGILIPRQQPIVWLNRIASRSLLNSIAGQGSLINESVF